MNIAQFRGFAAKSREGGLCFSDDLIWRFHLAVESNSFVLLHGPSGSGKSSLAYAYSRYQTQDYGSPGYCGIHVRPEMKDSSILMGHYVEERKLYDTTAFLDLLLAALRVPSKRFYVIIDGLGVAKPEEFMGDFINSVSSRHPVRLHPKERCVAKSGTIREEANLVCHESCDNCFFSSPSALPGRLPSIMSKFVPPMVYFPKNFVVIATILGECPLDDLSIPLLDRAHLFELLPPKVEEYLAIRREEGISKQSKDFLCRLDEVFHNHGLSFGISKARQCIEYLKKAKAWGVEEKEALDQHMEQSFMPRLLPLLKKREGGQLELVEDLKARLSSFELTRALSRLCKLL